MAGTCEEERRVTAPFLQGREEPRGEEGRGGGKREVLEAQGEDILVGVAGSRRVDLTGRRDLRLSERGQVLRAVVGSLEVGAPLRKCGGEGLCCRKG